MRTIFVLAKDMDRYHQAIQHIAPGIERFHVVRFTKRGNIYECPKFTIRPALHVHDVKGYKGWQLVKFGAYYENDHAAAIEKEYQIDLALRKEKIAPSVGQD